MFGSKTKIVTTKLRKVRIVPVLVLDTVEDGMRICELLNRADIKTAEITFRTSSAEEIIKEASSAFPEMMIGAGTVLTTKDLHKAFDAGAQFAVAPGFNPTVVNEAVKSALPFMPGVNSPTQIEQAMELGINDFKFFPAEASGGTGMLKGLIAPYRHLGITFIPTGGINPENMDDYLAIPEVIAVGGTWLGAKDGNWSEARLTSM